ncbi:hypothetical protein PIROE2DRAFT_41133 [Piromyces sp. E2]|nr:hypothetical protein PIROE2DRAFT_41133 [Piromyces sp. E2]|eukprot:OUM66094.1 hypothetical protein PIROE2DRAFT_41133 [Piromyces sp. E2]
MYISKVGTGRVVVEGYRNVTLGVDRCECFGLLGPNGSGKSTLLNTAAFLFQPNLGHVYYNGKDTLYRKTNCLPLGFCAQEDTVWEQMTLYEHIEMYLYLQGYSKKEARRLAIEFIEYCRLTSHKDKLPYQLSGGTRRKLNILIALCCNSTNILLDEPTAGMDPSTRRYVWDMFKSSIQSRQASTIMCTHSMEEAELLCNRICIIVNGKLRCIGSPEHIKMKYGNTYVLEVQTNDVERFHQEVIVNRGLFHGQKYTRKDQSLERVKYEVEYDRESHNNSISQVFKTMEECRSQGLFSDYSYSKCSLENIFLNFAILKELETQRTEENKEGEGESEGKEGEGEEGEGEMITITTDEQNLLTKKGEEQK